MKTQEMKQIEKDTQYEEFELIVKTTFEEMVNNGAKLFLTDADNLWEAYLNNLPKNKEHYNCRACKNFIRKYGSLATLDANGDVVSVLWSKEVPEFFEESVREMNDKVEKSNIVTPFISDTCDLGVSRTGDWSHIHVVLPNNMKNKSRLKTDTQIMAERKEELGMLTRALEEYSMSTIETAIELLNSQSLYRSDRCLGVAQWFKKVKEEVESTKNTKRQINMKWYHVSTAKEGYCHVRSSMIGTLLDDIQSGMSFELVSRRFEEKMNPSNYMRSQSAPTQGAVENAEKVVEKLGIANSLERRYATIDEIEDKLIWKNREIKKEVKETKSKGIFGGVATKEINKPDYSSVLDMPATTMTWDKFRRTILSDAVNIEARITRPERLMAMVTASDVEAENILKWDNTFSWYYHGGADAEMKRRVEAAGGRHENNLMRCSLMWEGLTDLDLHCVTPYGKKIYFSNKQSSCGGYLDLDMNGIDMRSVTPVENIRWTDVVRNGIYKFYVHNFSERVNGRIGTPFKAELEVGGKIYSYIGNPLRDGEKETVFEFRYTNGNVEFLSRGHVNASSGNEWNVRDNEFVKVNGIVNSPNTWGIDNPKGEHIFFLLDGCKDNSEGKGRGFFNEMLKPELREIRKVLEAYMSNATIDGLEQSTASGLGFNGESDWDLYLKVETKTSKRYIKIDRLD
ncbi:MAG: hypothetical protein ACRCX8_11430 [Sarcina sp.]